MNRLLRSARFVSLMLISGACFLSHAHALSLIQTLLGQALAAAAQAPPVDIYLAIRTDGAVGSGTADDPFDASTPEEYDGLLGTYFRNTVFHYGPGTYRTTGYQYDSYKRQDRTVSTTGLASIKQSSSWWERIVLPRME